MFRKSVAKDETFDQAKELKGIPFLRRKEELLKWWTGF